MASIHAVIDEIIMKPMSPKYLVERVVARLAKKVSTPTTPGGRPERRDSLRKRDWSTFGDNVIPLRRQPQLERPL